MTTLPLVVLLAFSQQGSGIQHAQDLLRKLGVLGANQAKIFYSEDVDTEPEFVRHVFFSDAVVRIRSDGELMSYTWGKPKDIMLARRDQPPVVLAATALDSARSYTRKMWPSTLSRFRNAYEGADSIEPSWVVEYYPLLLGIEVDESHMGLVEIDAVGGELLRLISSNTPLPPPSVTPRISRQQAEAILYNQLAATRRDPAYEFRLPVDLRIWGGVRGYKKPGRLVYRIEANGYYPGREGAMLPKHLIKMDAMTGEIVYDATSYPGGAGPVDPKAVPLTKRTFNVILQGKKRIAAPGAMVKSLKEIATPPTVGKPAILMSDKGMISLTVSPDRSQVFLMLSDKKGDKWWKGQPNMALLAALRKL